MQILEKNEVKWFCTLPRTNQIKVLQKMADELRYRIQEDWWVPRYFYMIEAFREAAGLTYADLTIPESEVAEFQQFIRKCHDDFNEFERLLKAG